MSRLLAAVCTLGRWVAGAWHAVDPDLRDLEFFGGLALIAFAPWRLAIVGVILVVHAWLAAIFAARRS